MSTEAGKLTGIRRLLADALQTTLTLLRITIPLSLATRLLSEAGMTERLGEALAPLMELVGLPGTMGLVWATAMLTHLYGGMVVFASLAAEVPLTVAQVTVLTTMMLVAHALPVELRIAQKAGARLRAMAALRIGGALALGWLLHHLYRLTGTLQGPNEAWWSPPMRREGWLDWLRGEAQSIAAIFLIILTLLCVMKLSERIGLTGLLTRLLAPLLATLGMGRQAAPVTIIGMTLGLSYGGGLILRETAAGTLSRRDIFFSLALMGLAHSLVEDTLLMMVLGGHLSGLLWARTLFALVAVYVLVRALDRVGERSFLRHFFRAPAEERS